MTERQWLACDDPTPLLERVRGVASARKFLLFGSACCRSAGHLVSEVESREAVEAAERLADDGLPDDERRAVVLAAADAVTRTTGARFRVANAARLTLVYADELDNAGPAFRALTIAREVRAGQKLATWEDAACAVAADQVALARCIFGNPFRPAALDPAWLTPTVAALARQAYESRDFGAIPILADALQDAGCDGEDVLDHCRCGGPHARGCWVVDLVLGKG